ncbi:type IV pilus biogenesis protein PilP [Acidiferrobacter thiooxydans]|uniref:Type IV pilus biogenesis protein PilP n=1 Tax=Acidiferrobacter thiooxydans TaxID=163359 RepID=A0A368HBD5_9GAMM|nr:type IV pilus biogenesis protein PilP [Acidiferrobacter thiooxydans]RCN55756.1 type IV pilus biogenesis protein PilP [Acidiferrobacter thiooxydans]
MSHRTGIGHRAILLLLLAGPPVWATPRAAAPAPRDDTLSALMRLRAETVILKQELKIAQLRAQIHKVRAPVPLMGRGAAPTGGATLLLPKIRSVTGSRGHMEATLENPDGSVQTVRDGSRLADGGHVTRITSRTVWVALGRAPAQALAWIPESASRSGGPMERRNGLSPTANLRSLLLGTPGVLSTPAPAPLPAMPAPPPAPASPRPATPIAPKAGF